LNIQVMFNGKKSYDDFQLGLESISIQPPSKKKIKESVPFMNGSYDFSTIGSSGEPVYSERSIKVKFNLFEKNRSLLYIKYSNALEWLLDAGQAQLIFTDMPNYYYLAEVENAPSFEEVISRLGIFEIEFVAEPFKYGIDYEGDGKLWDTFCFETDALQDTSFDVTSSLNATIINTGRPIIPQIIVSANMSCTLNGYTAVFTPAKDKDYKFKFQPGENQITINGVGNIEFKFRKEVL
jgi:predicted phage tail component-like protein